MSADDVSIELEWRRDWCARHLEPFRVAWPKGAVTAMTEVFQRSSRHPSILSATAGDATKLAPVLIEFGPLCCLLGDEEMAEVYAAAGVEGLK